MKLFNFSVFLVQNVESVTPTGCCDTYQVNDEKDFTCRYMESQAGKQYTNYDGFECSYREPGSSVDMPPVYMKWLDGTAPNGRGVPKWVISGRYDLDHNDMEHTWVEWDSTSICPDLGQVTLTGHVSAISGCCTDSGSSGSSTCADGWTSISGKCVKVTCTTGGWHDAQAACQVEHAWLATVDDAASNDAIYALTDGTLIGGRTWIGGTDEVVEGTWVDANGQPMPYTNWWTDGVTTEPDNVGNQDCAFMNFLSPKSWGDIQCDYQLPCYACQKTVSTTCLCPNGICGTGDPDGGTTGTCPIPAGTPNGCCSVYRIQDEYDYTCTYKESQSGKQYTDYDGFECIYRSWGSTVDEIVYMKWLDGTAPNGRGVPKWVISGMYDLDHNDREYTWVEWTSTNHCPPITAGTEWSDGTDIYFDNRLQAVDGCCPAACPTGLSCDQTDTTVNIDDFDLDFDNDSSTADESNGDSPCPSDDCWTYDETSGECELNTDAACSSVKCEAKEMSMSFSKGLFGEDNGAETISPTPVADGSDYVLQCELGQCGMRHFVENDNLVFELDLKQGGGYGSTISLGDVSVVTSPSGVSVTMRCEYPLDVTVTSDTFAIQAGVESTGVQSGVGSLADGFSLTLGSDSVVLGRSLEVTVAWELTFDDISFYFNNCNVEQGSSVVSIVKSGCYSETLQVTPTSDNSFTMMTFTIDSETDSNQFVVCSITLCMADCDKPTADEQCPSDEHYAYSITGY